MDEGQISKCSDIDTRHAALHLAVLSFRTNHPEAKPPRPATVLETAKLFDAYITSGKVDQCQKAN